MSVETRKTKAGKNRYIARIKAGGQLVASRSFDRKNDALAWEREQLRLITTGRPLPPKKSFTLAELVKRFQQSRKDGNPHTNDTDNNNLAALPKSLLLRPLSTVQASDIREHLIAELASGKAPTTVARAKTTLSALFTYADDHGLLHQPHPVRSMRKIPELGEVALRSINPGEIPTAGRIDKVLRELRDRRADIADIFEFMSLTGLRWGEVRAMRVSWLSEVPLPQLNVERSHSDRYEEKSTKSWRGRRPVPLSPRGLEIFRAHAAGKYPDDYLFTNKLGGQFKVSVIRKFPLGFRRHALRHYAASTWLRLGTPIHEVAEYLGDDARTVLKVYAHVLGEGQRRDFVNRLTNAEKLAKIPGHSRDTWNEKPSEIQAIPKSSSQDLGI
ncbi:tyrosine-type recombinase/integrase [Microbacterium sp. YMB-B2]|uniref:Tyrosine-type recombinase/integrase n=1 Tax=Microbacterium tenebrionis TaxID=2830665 RepID=A0A9X1LNE2_9MICO|nr:tyrosine-type recombinase/integrase [Microbacterium tenebrionis]MCC2028808.1 tyrosine-type recombinase/integrase [Microbacterium tenebrionis]